MASQATPEALLEILNSVEQTIHSPIPGVFPRCYLEHQGGELKVWEAIIPAPLYGSPIRVDGVFYTPEAAAHSLLLRLAHFEAVLQHFKCRGNDGDDDGVALPSSMSWLFPADHEVRVRFWCAVNNALQHRRKTRDAMVVASVLRWQEEQGVVVIDRGVSRLVANSCYSSTLLGVGPKDHSAANTAAAPSTAAVASTGAALAPARAPGGPATAGQREESQSSTATAADSQAQGEDMPQPLPATFSSTSHGGGEDLDSDESRVW